LKLKLKLKLKLRCDRQSVGQCVLVSGSHLEPMTRFLLSVWQLWVSWCLWREDGSVLQLYNSFWALPEQSLSGPNPQNSRPYFAVSFGTLQPGSRSHITADDQSVRMSRFRAHSGTYDQILLSVRRLFSESCCEVRWGYFTTHGQSVSMSQLYPPSTEFVASYDSQSYGGGIVTRLHMGLLSFWSSSSRSESRSYFTTDSQSVNMPWYRVPLWDLRPDIISCRNVLETITNVPFIRHGPHRDRRYQQFVCTRPGKVLYRAVA
jgi:hypothetical protein